MTDIKQKTGSVSSGKAIWIVVLVIAVIVAGLLGFFTGKQQAVSCDAIRQETVKVAVDRARVMELVNVSLEAMQIGQNKLAEKKLREAMELAPENAVIYYNLAILDIRNDDISACLKNLETAFMKDPKLLKQVRQDGDFRKLYDDREFMALENRFR